MKQMCHSCFPDFHIEIPHSLLIGVILSYLFFKSCANVQFFHIFSILPSEARLGCTQEEIGRGEVGVQSPLTFFLDSHTIFSLNHCGRLCCFGHVHGCVFCVKSLTRQSAPSTILCCFFFFFCYLCTRSAQIANLNRARNRAQV